MMSVTIPNPSCCGSASTMCANCYSEFVRLNPHLQPITPKYAGPNGVFEEGSMVLNVRDHFSQKNSSVNKHDLLVMDEDGEHDNLPPIKNDLPSRLVTNRGSRFVDKNDTLVMDDEDDEPCCDELVDNQSRVSAAHGNVDPNDTLVMDDD